MRFSQSLASRRLRKITFDNKPAWVMLSGLVIFLDLEAFSTFSRWRNPISVLSRYTGHSDGEHGEHGGGNGAVHGLAPFYILCLARGGAALNLSQKAAVWKFERGIAHREWSGRRLY